jgi:hypothetical protein
MTSEITLFSNGNKIPAHLKNREMDDVTKSLLGGGSVTRSVSRSGAACGGCCPAVRRSRSTKTGR